MNPTACFIKQQLVEDLRWNPTAAGLHVWCSRASLMDTYALEVWTSCQLLLRFCLSSTSGLRPSFLFSSVACLSLADKTWRSVLISSSTWNTFNCEYLVHFSFTTGPTDWSGFLVQVFLKRSFMRPKRHNYWHALLHHPHTVATTYSNTSTPGGTLASSERSSSASSSVRPGGGGLAEFPTAPSTGTSDRLSEWSTTSPLLGEFRLISESRWEREGRQRMLVGEQEAGSEGKRFHRETSDRKKEWQCKEMKCILGKHLHAPARPMWNKK